MSANSRIMDDLYVLRQDGEMVHDAEVRHLMGLVICDRQSWVLPQVQPAPIYGFVAPDAPAIKDRSAFIYRKDPPDVLSDDWILLRVTDTAMKMGRRSDWRPWKPFAEKIFMWRYIFLAIALAGNIFLGYAGTQADLELEKLEMRQKAAQAATAAHAAAMAGEEGAAPVATPPPPVIPDELVPAEGANGGASDEGNVQTIPNPAPGGQ